MSRAAGTSLTYGVEDCLLCEATEDQDRLGSNGVDYAANVVLTSTKEHVLGTAHDASRLKNGWRTRADALTVVCKNALDMTCQATAVLNLLP